MESIQSKGTVLQLYNDNNFAILEGLRFRSQPDSLVTLHGTGTRGGTGNGTCTTGNNGVLVPIPALDQCEHFSIIYWDPFIPFLVLVQFPVPFSCSVNMPLR